MAVAEGLITPDQLRRITEEKEKVQEALDKKRKADDEHQQLHDAFMPQQIHPDVFERRSKMVRGAAERGEREVLVVRFPAVPHRWRAGDQQFQPEWPESLASFAKRDYEFWQKELEPQGYKLRGQIMDFPGGVPGDVGRFLRW